jgi:hypothetical protein
MQAFGRHDMRRDQIMKRLEQLSHGPDLIGERGEAEVHPLAGISLGLAVQRLMLAELFEHDHRQQARPGPTARRRMERRRGLRDLLAVAAGELFPDGLDHLPLPRHHFERFGDVFAHLHDAVRAATGAAGRRFDHHALARQMPWEGFAHRLLAVESRDLRGLFGPGRILGGVGHQLLELQFQLIDQPGRPFGAVTVVLAQEPRDLKLEARDHRLGGRNHRARLRQFGLGGGQLGAEFLEV